MKKILIGLTGILALSIATIQFTAAQTAATTTQSSTQTNSTMKTNGYVPYEQKEFEAASKQKRVLFFAASWCPTCRSADKDINANLKKIPSNLIIFKTDYDTQTALKKTYGITHQHTFVYVDAKGKALKIWSGGELDSIIENTKDVK